MIMCFLGCIKLDSSVCRRLYVNGLCFLREALCAEHESIAYPFYEIIVHNREQHLFMIFRAVNSFDSFANVDHMLSLPWHFQRNVLHHRLCFRLEAFLIFC